MKNFFKFLILQLLTFIVIITSLTNLNLFNSDVAAATTIYTVDWSSGFESFSWTQPSCTLLASCTEGRVNDTGVSTNVLFTRVGSLAGGQSAGYWRRDLTWQNMGVPIGATVTQIDGQIDAKLQAESTNVAHIVNVFMFDSSNTTNIIDSDAAVEGDYDPTPVGTWNTHNVSGSLGIKPAYSKYDSAVTIRLGQTTSAGLGIIPSGEVRLHNLSLTITYELPTYSQSNYRIFSNLDSTNVGAPLADENTGYQMTDTDEEFRLRQVINISNSTSFASIDTFKLQFVDKGAGTCASPSGAEPGSYTDVTDSTAIAYYNNATPADGAALTSNGSDPTGTGTLTKFTYEEANNFINSTDLLSGDSGMWDFSLYNNSAPPDKTYCFRVVKSNGTALTSYDQYPEISTKDSILSVDLVDELDNVIVNPTTSFTTFVQRAICTTNSVILGTSTQKIRILNSTLNPLWTLSIAATSGPTSNWSSGGSFFDFNDALGSGCSDGIDADSYAGQLLIDPSTATATPQTGCNNTGIVAGSAASFVEGSVDSITLLTSSGSTQIDCYWDITDISLEQTLPQGLAVGTYTLDFTLTLVAN